MAPETRGSGTVLPIDSSPAAGSEEVDPAAGAAAAVPMATSGAFINEPNNERESLNLHALRQQLGGLADIVDDVDARNAELKSKVLADRGVMRSLTSKMESMEEKVREMVERHEQHVGDCIS